MNEKLKRAAEAYAAACKTLEERAQAYSAAPDDATDEQLEELSRAFDEAKAEAETRKKEHDKLDEIERARVEHPTPSEPAPGEEREGEGVPAGSLRVTEPPVYAKHNLRDSYFLDLARKSCRVGVTGEVEKRIDLHTKQIQAESERRDKLATGALTRELDDMVDDLLKSLPVAQAQRVLRAIENEGSLIRFTEQRAGSRLDGSGGEFVPPLWMLDEYAALARASRPFADEVRKIPLPSGTDTVNIPRITTGSLTGFQAQDNQALANQDLATAMVEAPVRTVGGYQDYALQLLEQSPIAFDQLIYEDLMSDMDLRIDIGCISGDGGPGNFLGILNVAGINAITYTDATPTIPELYPKLADCLNQAANNRKRVPTHFWWHTRRWFWAAKELDSQFRPFFIAASNGPTNAYGVSPNETIVEGGPVTNVIGVPLWINNSMPTNLGGGTNEDRVIATRMLDHVLMEGDIRAEAFREPLSDKVGVRFRIYKYAAFTAGRFPAGTSVASGTGFTTPTF